MLRWARSLLGSARTLVGKDAAGNKYFEIELSNGKTRRSVEGNLKHVDYTAESIPPEWQAWIRGMRQDAPTSQETIERQQKTATIQSRAQQLKTEDDERQRQAYKDGLVSKDRSSQEPPTPREGDIDAAGPPSSTSKAKQPVKETFEPDAWKPGGR